MNFYQKTFALLLCLSCTDSLFSFSLLTFRPNGGRFGDDLLNVTKMMYGSWVHKVPVIFPRRPFFNQLHLSEHGVSPELYQSWEHSFVKNDTEIYRVFNKHVVFESDFYMNYAALKKTTEDSIVQAMMLDRYFVEMMRFLMRPRSDQQFSYIDKSVPSIGVHIRRGGGFDDADFMARNAVQFCPDSYYIDSLARMLDQVGLQRVNVYIFTDDAHPEDIITMLQKNISNKNISFICKSTDVHYDNLVLSDFFSMMDCDYLIRPKSAFSIMAEFLGNHAYVISPRVNHDTGKLQNIETAYDFPDKSESPFVLITSLYNEAHPERLKEYLYCLRRNLEHPLIGAIHVLYDTTKDDENNQLLHALQEAGVTIEYITGRPSYEHCFEVARTLYPGKKILVSNADIFFNYTLFYLCNYDLKGKFIALTRWDVEPDATIVPMMSHGRPVTVSQDVWIFESPLSNTFNDASMCLGTQHCDGKIAFQAKKIGYQVVNPCLSVQACHMHISDVRHYELEGEWTNAMAVGWSYL